MSKVIFHRLPVSIVLILSIFFAFPAGASIESQTYDSASGTFTATIKWTTDKPATSQVEYGTNNNYGCLSGENKDLVKEHRIILSNLSPSQIYHYRVRSKDLKGNIAVDSA